MDRRSSRVLVAALALVACMSSRSLEAQGIADDDLWRGVQAFRSADYPRAVALFSQYRTHHPTAELSNYLGPAYYKLGDYERARSELVRAYRRGDQDPLATYYLGLTYYQLGFVALSTRAFTTLLQQQSTGKLADGARRHLAVLATDTTAIAPSAILAFAETLQTTAPDLALDYASEALLRGATDAAPRVRSLLAKIVTTQLPEYRPWLVRLDSFAPSAHAATLRP